ncbi:MAG: acyl-CoA synthetase FdrA [Chloroflexota bacterium]|nr:acyl-CoA synthetase FdrA [Chloroflexota bacterium]
MITRTNIKSGEYYDSVTLMEVAQGLLDLEGVVDAAVVMGTPANKGILTGADLLTPEAQVAVADDLVIAVRTESAEIAAQAMELAEVLLEETSKVSEESGMLSPPKTMEAAIKRLDGANMVLISVAGRYAGDVAREALNRGQHVFLFSDNVTVEDEIALKELGREKGLLVMGPDAGTAIINGVALGFANAVPAGPVGVVAASGTGLQSVTSSLARMDVGITQAIGTGGRDLKTAVGGIMMLEGLKALQADPATEVLLLVSKPPAPEVAEKVLAQLGASEKPAVVCFLGGDPATISAAGGIPAETLEEAAYLAAAVAAGQDAESSLAQLAADNAKLQAEAQKLQARLQPGQKYFRGLFSGGTFCYETQLILKELGLKVVSNAPVDKKLAMADSNISEGHVVVDLGEDEFTVGRLHPMIDPTLRNRRIIQEAADPKTAVIFLDVVLGYGVHPDPAGSAVAAIQEARALAKEAGREVLFVASVCGTPGDPQNSVEQEAKLKAAGVQVLPTNAAATRLAGYILA